MKPLLSITSPLYLKRLVRALNFEPDSFYASIACHVSFNGVRCNRARYKKGSIEVHSFKCKPTWFVPVNHNFEDCYARQIVASRTP